MTTTYTLWDLPSSTLLLETTNLTEIEASATSFLQDNGTDALDELLLGVTTSTADSAQEFTGMSILRVLEHEKVTQTTA